MLGKGKECSKGKKFKLLYSHMCQVCGWPGSHSSITQEGNWEAILGFCNLWFYTFRGDLCLEKCHLIYPVTIILQFIHQMWKNNNIFSQLNQWRLCPGYPQIVHDPSGHWQHKSCYLNILLRFVNFGRGWGESPGLLIWPIIKFKQKFHISRLKQTNQHSP